MYICLMSCIHHVCALPRPYFVHFFTVLQAILLVYDHFTSSYHLSVVQYQFKCQFKSS